MIIEKRHGTSRRLWPAVLGLVGAVALLFAPVGVASAKGARQSPVSIAVGVSGRKLTVRISSKARANCRLVVTTKHKSSSFPPLYTTKTGRVVIVWSVPSDAPSGNWKFAIACKTARHTYRATKRLLLINHGSGHGPLITPGSGRIGAGTLALGGKGGGSGQTCAVDLGGGTVCFTNDPFGYYQGGTDVGECTWYAAGRRPDLDGIVTGNAADWLNEARGRVPEGTTPVIGAIAVWTYGAGGAGHVAYVTNVLNNGATVVVDESNYARFHTVSYGRQVPANQISGYIYGGPAGNGAGGGGNGPIGNGYEAAFQANTSNLWSVGSDQHGDWGLGMMQGTSPSITALANGGYEMAFQANTGNLWVAGSAGSGDLHLGMMQGTSPSITALPNGGYEVAFQANTGNLWVAGSAGSGDLHLGMMHGTSPSITGLPNGAYEVAFQANTGNLWSVGSDQRGDWGLGMMQGTSPSITALANGGYEMAFQANTGNLWVAGSAGSGDLHLGMMRGTSPAVAR